MVEKMGSQEAKGERPTSCTHTQVYKKSRKRTDEECRQKRKKAYVRGQEAKRFQARYS